MKDTYSLYDAKAKLSAIIRRVREGHSVVVTLHGEPVAEIRPLVPAAMGIEARMAEMEARGVLIPARSNDRSFKPLINRPGGLKRFLDDRNK